MRFWSDGAVLREGGGQAILCSASLLSKWLKLNRTTVVLETATSQYKVTVSLSAVLKDDEKVTYGPAFTDN